MWAFSIHLMSRLPSSVSGTWNMSRKSMELTLIIHPHHPAMSLNLKAAVEKPNSLRSTSPA